MLITGLVHKVDYKHKFTGLHDWAFWHAQVECHYRHHHYDYDRICGWTWWRSWLCDSVRIALPNADFERVDLSSVWIVKVSLSWSLQALVRSVKVSSVCVSVVLCAVLPGPCYVALQTNIELPPQTGGSGLTNFNCSSDMKLINQNMKLRHKLPSSETEQLIPKQLMTIIMVDMFFSKFNARLFPFILMRYSIIDALYVSEVVLLHWNEDFCAISCVQMGSNRVFFVCLFVFLCGEPTCFEHTAAQEAVFHSPSFSFIS